MEPANSQSGQEWEDDGLDVVFEDADPVAVVRALYKKFPSEWIALHLGETDPVTGLTSGRVIAHHESMAMLVYPLRAFTRKHNGDVEVDLFRTDMYEPAPQRRY